MRDQADKLLANAQTFMSALPHCRALGISIDAMEPGKATLSMPYDERLIGDPDSGVIHGGAVSALLDSGGGAAVMSHPNAGSNTATLGLRIDYLRSATPGQRIRAVAECYHVTRNVAFVRATATDDDHENPVATANGTFTVGRKT